MGPYAGPEQLEITVARSRCAFVHAACRRGAHRRAVVKPTSAPRADKLESPFRGGSNESRAIWVRGLDLVHGSTKRRVN